MIFLIRLFHFTLCPIARTCPLLKIRILIQKQNLKKGEIA